MDYIITHWLKLSILLISAGIALRLVDFKIEKVIESLGSAVKMILSEFRGDNNAPRGSKIDIAITFFSLVICIILCFPNIIEEIGLVENVNYIGTVIGVLQFLFCMITSCTLILIFERENFAYEETHEESGE